MLPVWGKVGPSQTWPKQQPKWHDDKNCSLDIDNNTVLGKAPVRSINLSSVIKKLRKGRSYTESSEQGNKMMHSMSNDVTSIIFSLLLK